MKPKEGRARGPSLQYGCHGNEPLKLKSICLGFTRLLPQALGMGKIVPGVGKMKNDTILYKFVFGLIYLPQLRV